jgi:hypothetical protein
MLQQMKLPAGHPALGIISIRLFFVCGLLSCFSLATPARAASDSENEMRDGFFLIHGVCHEESQVHLITMMKTTPPWLVDYVTRISKLADDTLDTLDDMEDHDPALKSDDSPLPAFERAVRASIKDEKRHDLLFGTKDAAFSRALILTQLDAANYIANIAKVLSDEDEDDSRARKLDKISSHWAAIRREGIQFLSVDK